MIKLFKKEPKIYSTSYYIRCLAHFEPCKEMKNGTAIARFLDDIQCKLDDEHEKFTKRDFDCKFEHHSLIKPLLTKLDELISNTPGISRRYWGHAFLNYEVGIEILPTDEANNINVEWIKSLEVDYINGYIYKVYIELNENDFVCNESLTKIIHLEERKIETTEVAWKGNAKHPIFAFFESETEDFVVFDILYELYVNSAFYFSLSNKAG